MSHPSSPPLSSAAAGAAAAAAAGLPSQIELDLEDEQKNGAVEPSKGLPQPRSSSEPAAGLAALDKTGGSAQDAAARAPGAAAANANDDPVPLVEWAWLYNAVTTALTVEEVHSVLTTPAVYSQRNTLFPVASHGTFALSNADTGKLMKRMGLGTGGTSVRTLPQRLAAIVDLIEQLKAGEALSASPSQLEAAASGASSQPTRHRSLFPTEVDDESGEDGAKSVRALLPSSPMRASQRQKLIQKGRAAKELEAAAAVASSGHASSASVLKKFQALQAESGASKARVSISASVKHAGAKVASDSESDEAQSDSDAAEALENKSSSSGSSSGPSPIRRRAKASRGKHAAKKEKKLKKKKRSRRHHRSSSSDSSSSSSSSDSSDDEFGSLTGDALGRPIAKKIRSRLPCATWTTYVDSFATFNHIRNEKECRSLALSLDQFEMSGVSYSTVPMEIMVRRFLAVQSADTSGNWGLAEAIAFNERGQTLMPASMLAKVMKHTAAVSSLQNGGAGSGSRGPYSRGSGANSRGRGTTINVNSTGNSGAGRTGRDRRRGGGNVNWGDREPPRERSNSRSGRGGRGGRGGGSGARNNSGSSESRGADTGARDSRP